MQATILAQSDPSLPGVAGPDWERITSAILAVVGLAAAAYTKFRDTLTEKPPVIPPKVEAPSGVEITPLAALESVVGHLQMDNERLWTQVNAQAEEITKLKRMMNQSRSRIYHLRHLLIQTGGDPGNEMVDWDDF